MAHLVTAHSYYSLLEGGSSPLALASRAAEQGCAAFALTDHNMLTGAVEFALACRKVSIRPIFGLEVDINDSSANTGTGQHSRLTLLSENAEGWSNLSRLSSLTNLEKSRPFTIDEIARHSDGLIFLSGGTRGFSICCCARGKPHPSKVLAKSMLKFSISVSIFVLPAYPNSMEKKRSFRTYSSKCISRRSLQRKSFTWINQMNPLTAY